MKKIPIVFSFDDNFFIPACVCVDSLLASANEGTEYDIYILHGFNLSNSTKEKFSIFLESHSNYIISFINVGDRLKDSYEIRGITIATYYRLLIPSLITKYDKILYSDVDIIFEIDLTELYSNTNFNSNLIAGVKVTFSDKKTKRYLNSINCNADSYVNAGLLVLNNKLLIENKVYMSFLELIKNRYYFQDQDIINIVCKDKIAYIDPKYNNCQEIYKLYHLDYEKFKEKFHVSKLDKGIIHYTGSKPWDSFCYRYDIWWSKYRTTSIFSENTYFQKQVSALSYNNIGLKRLLNMLFDRFLRKLAKHK